MISWKIESGILTEMYSPLFKGNMIHPWGMETADSDAFFSLDTSVGYRYDILAHAHNADEKVNENLFQVKMKEGQWQLKCQDKITTEDCIERSAELTALDDTVLMDFVLRFRFLKDNFSQAMIDDKIINHENSNRYHQYSVREVKLLGALGSVCISIDEQICTQNFLPQMYVRDRGDEWIIHARMMPVKPHKTVIKLCSRWFRTKALPQFLTNVLLSSGLIRDQLLYRNERNPYTALVARFFNPNAFHMGLLKKGEKLKWKVKCQIH